MSDAHVAYLSNRVLRLCREFEQERLTGSWNVECIWQASAYTLAVLHSSRASISTCTFGITIEACRCQQFGRRECESGSRSNRSYHSYLYLLPIDSSKFQTAICLLLVFIILVTRTIARSLWVLAFLDTRPLCNLLSILLYYLSVLTSISLNSSIIWC